MKNATPQKMYVCEHVNGERVHHVHFSFIATLSQTFPGQAPSRQHRFQAGWF